MKRWSKQPDEKGLSHIIQTPRGFQLKEDGKVVAVVSPTSRTLKYWYWYGFGQNTYYQPVESSDEAKKQVMEFIKANGK